MKNLALSGRVRKGRKGESVADSMLRAWDAAVDAAWKAGDEKRLRQLLEIASLQLAAGEDKS